MNGLDTLMLAVWAVLMSGVFWVALHGGPQACLSDRAEAEKAKGGV